MSVVPFVLDGLVRSGVIRLRSLYASGGYENDKQGENRILETTYVPYTRRPQLDERNFRLGVHTSGLVQPDETFGGPSAGNGECDKDGFGVW